MKILVEGRFVTPHTFGTTNKLGVLLTALQCSSKSLMLPI